MNPELHLFVIWSAARGLEDKIIADMRRHLEIVWKGEFPIEGRARDFYRRFYAHMLLDGKRKEKSCGKGPYLLLIVKDDAPEYVRTPKGMMESRRMLKLKTRYREWAVRGCRVHSTLTHDEFVRDVRLLTGHTADEWAQGVPEGSIAPNLPPLASLPHVPGFFERFRMKRAQRRMCAMKKKLSKRVRAAWWNVINTKGAEMGIADCRVMLENKLVNDIFFEGTFKGLPCIVKCSSRAPESIANEYELGRRLHAVDPVHFPAVYGYHPGPFAFVVTEKIEGGKSLADEPDEKYADEILAILDSLYAANVIHRDILPSNFLIAPDGHLKLIDFQFAVDMGTQCIDPWLKRHPEYHFTVFAAVIQGNMAWWDDADFATLLLPSLRERLRSRIGRMRFEIPFTPLVRLRLGLLAMRLRIRKMFCMNDARKRHAICRRLERFKWLSCS